MKKVLIVASGLSAKQYFDYDYKTNGWEVVVVNNAYKLIEDWDWWVHTDDYTGIYIPPKGRKDNEILGPQYLKSQIKYGGEFECGWSITLCASYWALDNLKPDIVGYLGADMNYTPNENGDTHFYGLGYDIQKRGISDPDFMVKRFSKGNPNYLHDLYMRFNNIANQENCEVYNLSTDKDTRLPYKKYENI